jgi:DNA-binding response OmpR family regulator/anti-sigma regulatory factor (Ser/Thr protein kinase)
MTVSVAAGPLAADVDVDQIEKVVANLLSNAVKFTSAGGAVRFSVTKEEGESGPELVIRVEDNGPGIAAEDQEDVFGRFQRRVDEGASGGTGLGLALVREITELHGGRVELRSAPGRGSRFTVVLPTGSAADRGAVASDAPPASDTEFDGTPEGTASSTKPDAGGASRVPPVDGSPDPTTPTVPEDGEDVEQPTILIVEDHEGLRAYIRRQLDPHYQVVEARDGLEGLDLARRIVPDLILCDIMMPGMDGDELCRIVRSDPEIGWLPVIMLTARASRESRLSALEGGADDYLVKPFDPDELRLRVANLIEGRKRHAEHLSADRGTWEGWVPPRPRTDPAFAEQLFTLLRERAADEEFGTTAMAKALAMSRSTLYRKVAESLDSSPAELLWSFRLEQAAQWLRETDARVTDVAYGCGFRTVPHFTRKFKERYGTTPAAWRSGAGSGS